jgi:hypothetical protein
MSRVDHSNAPTTPATRRLAGLNGHAPPAARATPLRTAPRPQDAVSAATVSAADDSLWEGTIRLGRSERGGAFGFRLGELMTGRLLVQGLSGAGKSWLLRKLLEECSFAVQQIVIDPEGEFRTLAALLDYPVVDAATLDTERLFLLGERVRRERLSLVLDLSQQERDAQMSSAAWFLRALVECAPEDWHPALVAIDEAHLFAPYGGQSAAPDAVRKGAIAALIDLMSRGRKRGLGSVIATQRLARLSASVRAEAQNFLIGRNSLDLDIRRAAEMIGWDARRAFDRLPLLAPGDFVAVGPAFPEQPVVAHIGPVRSRHLGAAPELVPPPRLDAAATVTLLDVEGLVQATGTGETADHRLGAGMRALRRFIRDPAFPFAARVWEALRPLHPDGARRASLAQALGLGEDELGAAIALLEGCAAVELRDDALRIPGAMLGAGQ